MKKNSIKIKEVEIAITGVTDNEYISLTESEELKKVKSLKM